MKVSVEIEELLKLMEAERILITAFHEFSDNVAKSSHAFTDE